MSSLKVSKYILTGLLLGFALAMGYGAFHYYIHLCKSERLNFAESRNQTTLRLYRRLQSQWDTEFEKLIQYAQLRLNQSNGQYSKALQVIHESQSDVINAFYIDRQMLYLPDWKKFRMVKASEDLSFNLMENPEFKQAEILEYQYQKFEDAVKIYERFWLENPNNFQAANALARCCYKLKDFSRADKIYQQIYNQNPDILVEGDVPLALIAAFQLLNIYLAQPNPEKAKTFGAELYNALLDEKWELTKTKTDFFKTKLRAVLNPYLIDPQTAAVFKHLFQRERSLEKSKTYARWISNQIIPFIENSWIQGYRIYPLEQPGHPPGFLLILPYLQGHLILDMDYPGFVHTRLAPLAQILAKDNRLGVVLHYADKTEAFSEFKKGDSRVFSLSNFFPDLSLEIQVPAQATAAIERHLQVLKKYFIAGYSLLLGVLLLVYLVLMKQIQFAELKSDFVSHVSHELKTPLTSLRMFSEMLQNQPRLAVGKRRQYYGILQAESIRLSRLIENLLDVSRIEKKKSQFRFQPENLNDVLRAALDIFNQSLKNSHRLKVKLRSNLHFPMDKDAIIQLVLNLLDNARKFSPAHSTIRLESQVQAHQVVVQIQDQGLGMTRSEIRKIFNKFYQGKKNYDDKFKGIGLGLAIVKNIAQAHRAKISLKSEPGCGTLVCVAFPCASSK